MTELVWAKIIISGLLFVIYLILRWLIIKLVRRFARSAEKSEHRTNLVIKYLIILLIALAIIALLVIWGVEPGSMLVIFSSVFAVIGVALFAQWSILSNITSGIILFFTAPFRIGDFIRIQDKDYPIEAVIEDIRGFHTYLRTLDGEFILYPNSLLLQKGISLLKKGTDFEEN